MSYVYMVKPFEVVDNKPVVPGAFRVSAIIYGYFVAYKKVGRVISTLAIIYRDFATGKFLVGATQEVMDTFPGGETLDEIVSVDPAGWGTWNCDTIGPLDEFGIPRLINGAIVFTTGILSTISGLLPLVLSPTVVAIGGQPSAPYNLAEFSVEDLEATTTWIGDHHAA